MISIAYKSASEPYIKIVNHSCVMKILSVLFLLLPFWCFAQTQTAEQLIQSGNTKANQKDYQGAIDDFTKAIELNPKSADAYFYRANANSNLQKNEEAVADFTKTIELNPKKADAYYYRGNANSNLR